MSESIQIEVVSVGPEVTITPPIPQPCWTATYRIRKTDRIEIPAEFEEVTGEPVGEQSGIPAGQPLGSVSDQCIQAIVDKFLEFMGAEHVYIISKDGMIEIGVEQVDAPLIVEGKKG